MTGNAFAEITKKNPKIPSCPVKETGGRNANGRITVRHQGGGVRRKYRVIDFKRDKDHIPQRLKQ